MSLGPYGILGALGQGISGFLQARGLKQQTQAQQAQADQENQYRTVQQRLSVANALSQLNPTHGSEYYQHATDPDFDFSTIPQGPTPAQVAGPADAAQALRAHASLFAQPGSALADASDLQAGKARLGAASAPGGLVGLPVPGMAGAAVPLPVPRTINMAAPDYAGGSAEAAREKAMADRAQTTQHAIEERQLARESARQASSLKLETMKEAAKSGDLAATTRARLGTTYFQQATEPTPEGMDAFVRSAMGASATGASQRTAGSGPQTAPAVPAAPSAADTLSQGLTALLHGQAPPQTPSLLPAPSSGAPAPAAPGGNPFGGTLAGARGQQALATAAQTTALTQPKVDNLTAKTADIPKAAADRAARAGAYVANINNVDQHRMAMEKEQQLRTKVLQAREAVAAGQLSEKQFADDVNAWKAQVAAISRSGGKTAADPTLRAMQTKYSQTLAEAARVYDSSNKPGILPQDAGRLRDRANYLYGQADTFAGDIKSYQPAARTPAGGSGGTPSLPTFPQRRGGVPQLPPVGGAKPAAAGSASTSGGFNPALQPNRQAAIVKFQRANGRVPNPKEQNVLFRLVEQGRL